MNDLFLDNKPWSYIRFGIGILSLLAALAYFIAHLEGFQFIDYFIIVSFTIVGIANMTNDFGMQKSYLCPKDKFIVIRWINNYRTRTIHFSEIENILIRKTEIIINQKNNKFIKLGLNTFRTDQKKEIYKFFIKLSEDFKLVLSRQFT